MALAQSRNAQVNQLMESYLQYLMQKKLIGQRQEGEMEYLTQQMGGYKELEEKRYGNQRQLMLEKFWNELAKDPEVDRLRTLVNLAQQQGKDPTPYLNKLNEAATQVTTGVVEMMTGGTDVTKLMPLIKNITEEALRTGLTTAGASWRTTKTTAQQEKTRELSERRLTEVEKPTLKVKEETLKLKKEKGGDIDSYYKKMSAKIMEEIKHLSKIAADPMTDDAVKAQILDTISKLSALETKAMTQPLAPEELAIIDQAWNPLSQQMKPQESSELEKLVSLLIQRGLPEAEARKRAIAALGITK